MFVWTGAQTLWPANGHYYELVSVGANFSSALTLAASKVFQGRQGHLVTITTADENAFVRSLIRDVAWIAASDAQQEGTWRWMAGPEQGQIINYRPWASGQPLGNLVENAVFLSHDLGWYDQRDSEPYAYVVEYECPITPVSTGPCARMSRDRMLVHPVS
jgi:hypothetical protein